LAAIRWLQQHRRMQLPTIRQYLKSVGAVEVERLAVAFLPELAAAPPAAAAVVPAPSASVEQIAASAAAVSDTWHRLTILPGLEVHVHSTASTEVKELARAVVERVRSAGNGAL
jgi:hypothetical protein